MIRTDRWPHWEQPASADRVTPLLYELVATVPTDLLEKQRERIWWLQRAVLLHAVRLEHHLIAVALRFSELEIPFAVLKGAATAHVDYPDPWRREFVDIDVLIDPAGLASSHCDACFRRLGAGIHALPRGREEHAHAVTFTFEPRSEPDLHQRIGHRALGILVPTREVLDRATPFEIGGVELWSLDEIDRLIHAAAPYGELPWSGPSAFEPRRRTPDRRSAIAPRG